MKSLRLSFPLWFIVFMTSLTAAMPILAQAACPVNLPQYITRAVRACSELTRNAACYGNGDVFATFVAPDSDIVFESSGDQIGIDQISELRSGGTDLTADNWGIARMEVQANLLAEQPARSSTFWLIGNASMQNLVPPVPELTATSKGTLNLRTEPKADADIIDQLGLRDSVTTNGRTEDNRWLRILVPRTETLAWVGTDVVTVEGIINDLDVVTLQTPYYRPFQIIGLTTGLNDSPCADVPDSGLLIQTPNDFTDVAFTVNEVDLRITGTVFIQTAETLIVNVLNGSAIVEAGGVTETIPAGARSLVNTEAGAAEPYLLTDLESLPIDALPYTFAIPAPLNQEQILLALHPLPTATPAEPDPNLVPRCVRTLIQDSNIRQGPGDFYEVLTTWDKGRKINAVYEQSDGDGYTWWQVFTGAWVRADYVESTGDCDDVPMTTVTTGSSRSNTLTLESCYTDNGPIRTGQHVTITFLDGGWESYGEASKAIQVAPSEISVGSTHLHVHASEPFLVSEVPERWYIRFSAAWTARPGTFKFEGERRYLRLRCNITVPYGR